MNKKVEKIFILSSDFITINLAWVLFFYFRVESGLFDLLVKPELILSMFAIYLYWLLIFIFVGMYRTWFAASRFDEISTLFKASFVGIIILYFAILYDDSTQGVSSSTRFVIFIYWFILLFTVGWGRILIRSFQRHLLIKGIGRKNCLIVGFNKKGFDIADKVEHHRGLGIDVVGFVSLTATEIGKSYKDKKVIGVYNEIKNLIQESNSKEIILAVDRVDEDVLLSIVNDADGENVNIKIVPDLYEIMSGQARTSQIYGLPLIDIMPKLMPEWEKKMKRLMDILISIVFLIFAMPIILITAIAIKIESKGPVFYKQERSGLNGKVFKIIKFRSMVQDAEKVSGPVWSTKDDPRITKVGKFVRKVRIDEIPQMINVLRGDMSMVGPRPERPFFVEKLANEIPLYKRRLKVRPGITGWAQVKHKYDETIEDVKMKLRYDLFYIENMSLRTDLIILFRTVFVVLFGKGHYD